MKLAPTRVGHALPAGSGSGSPAGGLAGCGAARAQLDPTSLWTAVAGRAAAAGGARFRFEAELPGLGAVRFDIAVDGRRTRIRMRGRRRALRRLLGQRERLEVALEAVGLTLAAFLPAGDPAFILGE